MSKLLAALLAHHKWHQEIGEVYYKRDDGTFEALNLSDAYADSSLCDQTIEALAQQRSAVQVKLEPGEKILTRYSYALPDTFVMCEGVFVEREWWQFWRPRVIYRYSIITTTFSAEKACAAEPETR